MSERTMKRLIGALGVLVVAWLIVIAASWLGKPDPNAGGGQLGEFVENIDTASLTAIVLAQPDADPIRLVRDAAAPTGWTVDGFAVDSSNIAQLVSSLTDAAVSAPVSTNPDNHARMEIDDAAARLLVLETTSGADTLLFGKDGPEANSVYARLPGTSDVHVLGAGLRTHASRSIDNWRSRSMATADTASIRSIEVTRAGDAYRLERVDSTWTVDGDTADADAVRSILGELAHLRASGFPGPDSTAQPDLDAEPARIVVARDAGGAERLTVRMWQLPDTTNTSITAIVEGGAARQPGIVFTYPVWQADRLAPEPADVRREEDEGGG